MRLKGSFRRWLNLILSSSWSAELFRNALCRYAPSETPQQHTTMRSCTISGTSSGMPRVHLAAPAVAVGTRFSPEAMTRNTVAMMAAGTPPTHSTMRESVSA